MHVLMGVGVVEAKPSGSEGGELRPDLDRQPAANARAEEVIEAQAQLISWKLASIIDQAWDRADRRTLDDNQM